MDTKRLEMIRKREDVLHSGKIVTCFKLDIIVELEKR
jgi:hypothetical protein